LNRIGAYMSLDKAKKEWLTQLGVLLAADVALPDTAGEETRAAGAVRDEPAEQSTVTLVNDTGSALRLVTFDTLFKTARFVPGVPPRIEPNDRAVFRVVEPNVGAPRTGGFAVYHFERRKFDVDVRFEWDRANCDVKFIGEGPFDKDPTAEVGDHGNTYKLVVSDTPNLEADKLEILFEVRNLTEMPMTDGRGFLADPEHSEFSRAPPKTIEPGHAFFRVQVLDAAFPEGAGHAVYRLTPAGKPAYIVTLRWRKGATPLGSVEPNDGAFIVDAAATEAVFKFQVEVHEGPPPTPPGPMRIKIANDSAVDLMFKELSLDSPHARPLSPPPSPVEGTRRGRLTVAAPDPEFPNTDGTVFYTFFPDAERPEVQSTVTMQWRRNGESIAGIDPPAAGFEAHAEGSGEAVTFVVSGPPLDFVPPRKGKQPTLRRGDKSADGWVEYLQELLNRHGATPTLVVNGDFNGATEEAVLAFQEAAKKKNDDVWADRIVGDQTWGLLRDSDVLEKPKTDGRKPHTYVEKGLEARWEREKGSCRYDAQRNALVMVAVSVGTGTALEGRLVRLRVTDPKNVQKVLPRPLGPPHVDSTTGQGSTHEVVVERFATLFDEDVVDGPPPGDYRVEGYFDDVLGGDYIVETLTIASP
jgi:hypothetical protein